MLTRRDLHTQKFLTIEKMVRDRVNEENKLLKNLGYFRSVVGRLVVRSHGCTVARLYGRSEIRSGVIGITPITPITPKFLG